MCARAYGKLVLQTGHVVLLSCELQARIGRVRIHHRLCFNTGTAGLSSEALRGHSKMQCDSAPASHRAMRANDIVLTELHTHPARRDGQQLEEGSARTEGHVAVRAPDADTAALAMLSETHVVVETACRTAGYVRSSSSWDRRAFQTRSNFSLLPYPDTNHYGCQHLQFCVIIVRDASLTLYEFVAKIIHVQTRPYFAVEFDKV